MKSNNNSSFISSKNNENGSFLNGKYNEDSKEVKNQTNTYNKILITTNIAINSESSHVEYHGSLTKEKTNDYFNRELNENNFPISDNALIHNLLNDEDDDGNEDEKINDFDNNNYTTNFNFNVKKNTINNKNIEIK